MSYYGHFWCKKDLVTLLWQNKFRLYLFYYIVARNGLYEIHGSLSVMCCKHVSTHFVWKKIKSFIFLKCNIEYIFRHLSHKT